MLWTAPATGIAMCHNGASIGRLLCATAEVKLRDSTSQCGDDDVCEFVLDAEDVIEPEEVWDGLL